MSRMDHSLHRALSWLNLGPGPQTSGVAGALVSNSDAGPVEINALQTVALEKGLAVAVTGRGVKAARRNRTRRRW